MQEYLCHKRVKAQPIDEIDMGPVTSELGGYGVTKIVAGTVVIEGETATRMCLRAVPKLDDYLVEYEDGYRAISPKVTFEAGYTLATA